MRKGPRWIIVLELINGEKQRSSHDAVWSRREDALNEIARRDPPPYGRFVVELSEPNLDPMGIRKNKQKPFLKR
jgi:hypothetical protein